MTERIRDIRGSRHPISNYKRGAFHRHNHGGTQLRLARKLTLIFAARALTFQHNTNINATIMSDSSGGFPPPPGSQDPISN